MKHDTQDGTRLCVQIRQSPPAHFCSLWPYTHHFRFPTQTCCFVFLCARPPCVYDIAVMRSIRYDPWLCTAYMNEPNSFWDTCIHSCFYVDFFMHVCRCIILVSFHAHEYAHVQDYAHALLNIFCVFVCTHFVCI